jgi:hypothetical protein
VEIYLHYPNASSWRGTYLSTGTTLPFTFAFTFTVDTRTSPVAGNRNTLYRPEISYYCKLIPNLNTAYDDGATVFILGCTFCKARMLF